MQPYGIYGRNRRAYDGAHDFARELIIRVIYGANQLPMRPIPDLDAHLNANRGNQEYVDAIISDVAYKIGYIESLIFIASQSIPAQVAKVALGRAGSQLPDGSLLYVIRLTDAPRKVIGDAGLSRKDWSWHFVALTPEGLRYVSTLTGDEVSALMSGAVIN